MKKWTLIDGNQVNKDGFRWAISILKNRTIIIADDNSSVLKWLKFSLEDYGANVYTFEHGKETIDFLIALETKHKKADILILDIIMNKIGGREIAKFSKKNYPKTNIMFLTGCQCDSEEGIKAAEYGIVIQKPAGLEDMISTIMTILVPDWENQYQSNSV